MIVHIQLNAYDTFRCTFEVTNPFTSLGTVRSHDIVPSYEEDPREEWVFTSVITGKYELGYEFVWGATYSPSCEKTGSYLMMLPPAIR